MKDQLVNLLEKLNVEQNERLLNRDIVEYIDKILNNATILKIIENDILIAFIAYYENNLDERKAFLSMLAVHPDYHNKGFGKLLLNQCISNLKEKGFKYFELEVLKSNSTAIKLYTKYGFRIVRSIKSKHYMRKTL